MHQSVPGAMDIASSHYLKHTCNCVVGREPEAGMAALRLGLTGRWWAEIAGSHPRQSLAQVAGFMSGSGHERRFCDDCGTSALPPILTVTADILNRQLRANRRHMQRSKLQSIRSPRQRGRAALAALRGRAPSTGGRPQPRDSRRNRREFVIFKCGNRKSTIAPNGA
jgi:hypothetical protein